MKGHPKQYILVDTIFNYRFHVGFATDAFANVFFITFPESPNSLRCRGSGGVSSVLGCGGAEIFTPTSANFCAQAQ